MSCPGSAFWLWSAAVKLSLLLDRQAEGSSHLEAAAIDYCENLKAGKKWAGFAVPVVIHSDSGQVHAFQRNPLWGRIYYPYFKQLIHKTTA